MERSTGSRRRFRNFWRSVVTERSPRQPDVAAGEAHAVPLSTLTRSRKGRVVRVTRDLTGRAERLAALGVTAGAAVHVLQTFPVMVFECDQTEMAIERAMARAILVVVEPEEPPAP
jgi:Fe2+ transport system protein FeoA